MDWLILIALRILIERELCIKYKVSDWFFFIEAIFLFIPCRNIYVNSRRNIYKDISCFFRVLSNFFSNEILCFKVTFLNNIKSIKKKFSASTFFINVFLIIRFFLLILFNLILFFLIFTISLILQSLLTFLSISQYLNLSLIDN